MSFLNQVLEQHFLHEITGPRHVYFTEGTMKQANTFLKVPLDICPIFIVYEAAK